jgi:hypothetical protein
MSQFNLIRNAQVEVKSVSTGTGKTRSTVAEIIVNGKYEHRFPAKSRVSKHLDVMQPNELAERLTGGSFFFVKDAKKEDQLVDFRDGMYNGFVHEDAALNKFMEILGCQPETALPMHRGRRTVHTDDADHGSKIVLRKVWSNGEIQVPGYQAGGEFNSQLSFVWNPFVKTINSSFDLIRLICTNGMVGLTSFLNTRVPLFNRWEEHLDIASRQIQNKVSGIVVDRVQTMASERASVGECLLLEQHVFDRLYSPAVKSSDERSRLLALMTAVSPKTHLSTVYKDNVFTEKALAAQLPAHLSQFDAWNIATELRSHTNDSAKSSGNALDRFANGIMFDSGNYTAAAGRFGAAKLSAFSSPERAFFGQIN